MWSYAIARYMVNVDKMWYLYEVERPFVVVLYIILCAYIQSTFTTFGKCRLNIHILYLNLIVFGWYLHNQAIVLQAIARYMVNVDKMWYLYEVERLFVVVG